MSSTFNITLIAGPTAAGKSATAMDIARAKNGVIINADALQIYQDLPILTAQPSADDREVIPHKLYGVLKSDQICSVTDWVARAVDAIYTAHQAGQHAIIVGGTGLYLNAIMHGLSPIPDIPDDVREASRALQEKLGNPGFHAALQKIDPVSTARLHPNDTQRLIRAHEVMVATEQSIDDWQAMPRDQPLPDATFDRILVDGPRDVLRDRAMIRLHQMVDHGVLDEIAAFQARIDAGAVASDAPPLRALGYGPFLDFVRGKITKDAAITAAHIDTAQYIKRQQTWIRHQMEFDRVIDISDA